MDLILSKDLKLELEESPLNVVENMSLEPKKVDMKFKEMLMYVSGIWFYHAHLWQIQHVVHLPKPVPLLLN